MATIDNEFSATLRNIMANMEPDWKDLIFGPAMLTATKTALTSLLEQLRTGIAISPELPKIFAAFNACPLGRLKCVVIGQDPYPSNQDATGLSFEVAGLVAPTGVAKSKKPNPSLKNIIAAMKKSRVLDVDLPDFRAIAAEGVLFLNAALTTENGKSNAHLFWHQWTKILISSVVSYKLRNAPNEKIHFLLWGDFAAKICGGLTCQNVVLHHWGHPSPLNRKNAAGNPESFENCDHFKIVGINWNAPRQKPVAINAGRNDNIGSFVDTIDKTVGTTDRTANTIGEAANNINTKKRQLIKYIAADGGCSGNGKPDAKASWAIAAFTVDGQFVYRTSGLVSDTRADGSKIAPTNNRGELTAIIEILKLVGRFEFDKSPVIISDSQLSINSITKWGHNWRKKGEPHDNTDLIYAAMDMIADLKLRGIAIEFYHTRGHRTEPARDSANWPIWYMNYIVDADCNSALGRKLTKRQSEIIGGLEAEKININLVADVADNTADNIVDEIIE